MVGGVGIGSGGRGRGTGGAGATINVISVILGSEGRAWDDLHATPWPGLIHHILVVDGNRALGVMVDGCTLCDGANLLPKARFGHHIEATRLGNGHRYSGWRVDGGPLRDGANMQGPTRFVRLEWDPGRGGDRLR